MDLSVKLGGTCRLKSCIMNASGAMCTTSEELEKLNASQSGAVVTKSS